MNLIVLIIGDITMKNKKIDVFKNSKIKVPFFYPSISKDDQLAVKNALNSPLLTDGPLLKKFESNFAKFTGAKYAIGVSNATSALHLSLKSLGISSGDEVIIPDMTFVATASSILFTGATPVVADIDNDLNISIESIEKNITKKTKAILPVHFAGKICNINKIKKIAKKNNLKLIEDCAHAIGTREGKKHVGTFGNAGCFSFYPTKNFTTIEGGMIITNSKDIAKYVLTARNHGLTRSLSNRFSSGKPWDYDVIEPGYNYRLDEIRSSLGLSQLNRINNINKLRIKIANKYNKLLKNIKGISLPVIKSNRNHIFHLYSIKIEKEYNLTRDELFKKLYDKNIGTSVQYYPLHLMSYNKNKYNNLDFPVANKIKNQILCLPIFPTMTQKQIQYVASNLVN